MQDLYLSFLVLVVGVLFSCAGHRASSEPAVTEPPEILIGEYYNRVNLPDCTTGSIQTKQGPLCGRVVTPISGKNVNAYLGIPFAESTAGDNRWRAPEPVKPWKGVLKATEFGPSCPQSSPVKPQSEDCLSVNVWTPPGVSQKPKAVMVFIYGGAFVYGSSADALYNGAYTAARGDVVVVSFHYRLGALGFLAGLKDKATGEEVNGNFGLQDQILALKWVRENIGSFGGDPERVTIYGESAGAMSVGLHLLSSPGSEGLFRAAIMESNPLGIPYRALKGSHAISKRFAHTLGCGEDDFKCMRGKLPEVVLDAQVQKNLIWPAVFHGMVDLFVWAPVIDGEVVTEQPVTAISRGKLKSPVVIGTNKNEGLLFVELTKAAIGKSSLSAQDYRLMLDFMIRDHALRERIYEKYPPVKGDNTDVVSRVITDFIFICPTRYTAEHSAPRTWSYAFNHVSSFNVWPKTPACATAVCYAAELPYVFHTAYSKGFDFNPEEAKLSDLIIDYWTSFAKDLNPGTDVVNWPPFGKDSLRLVFETPESRLRTVSDLKANCVLWDGPGYDLHDSFWGIF